MFTREDASLLPIGLPETKFNIPKTVFFNLYIYFN